MRLRWTPEATENLENINAYLGENLPLFARPPVLALYEAVRSLRIFPERGRPGTIAGTRELVLQRIPYLIVYRIVGITVEVLHIYHPHRIAEILSKWFAIPGDGPQ